MIYEIRPGRKEDADFLAITVMKAVGDELILEFAGCEERVGLVVELFRTLAKSEHSQYSYTNALVAVDTEDTPIGAIIGYDGARLRTLRKEFIREANRILDWGVTPEKEIELKDETNPDETYLDSLYVELSYRGKGIATSLFHASFKRFQNLGKPFGLLVEPSNTNARKLYEQLGFKPTGISDFFDTPMIHMQREFGIL